MQRAFAVLFLLSALVPVASGAASKPNIIFIVADDLGYGDIGAFGQRKIHTPNLERIMREQHSPSKEFPFPVLDAQK